ncbi:hypothetical protein Pr1d_27370 [Bythopirellula goksoeyrii]|uniref:Uncharacterized protein n=1 Tax=Bythopirellula goksoeyrii TaxID=1400387 RepID=A0A5B9Q926_9BACT|nr:hypothetical protein Pr1d_27370 [Bythopirellula goksoeyrii]
MLEMGHCRQIESPKTKLTNQQTNQHSPPLGQSRHQSTFDGEKTFEDQEHCDQRSKCDGSRLGIGEDHETDDRVEESHQQINEESPPSPIGDLVFEAHCARSIHFESSGAPLPVVCLTTETNTPPLSS